MCVTVLQTSLLVLKIDKVCNSFTFSLLPITLKNGPEINFPDLSYQVSDTELDTTSLILCFHYLFFS